MPPTAGCKIQNQESDTLCKDTRDVDADGVEKEGAACTLTIPGDSMSSLCANDHLEGYVFAVHRWFMRLSQGMSEQMQAAELQADNDNADVPDDVQWMLQLP